MGRMMEGMMGWVGLTALVSALVLLSLAAAVYVAVRFAGPGADRGEVETQTESARALLDRRLATGEIGAEGYYEREAALRSSRPLPRRRRGRA